MGLSVVNVFQVLPVGLLCSVCLFGNAQAATLREALEQAWAAQAEPLTARQAQYSAQLAASQAWTPQPPTIGLSNSTDQLNDDLGHREWEVELAAPIWLPGQRAKAVAVAEAQRTAFDGNSSLQRLQLAGQLRESWWALRLAEVDLAAARRQLAAAQQLAEEVERRVAAGELAALDGNQAGIGVQRAKRQQSLATLAWQRAEQGFALLARGAAVPDQDEVLAAPVALEQHPLLHSLQARSHSAQARLEQASSASDTAPELALTYSSERDEQGAAYRDRVKLGISIPFGTESRNQARISAANADWIEAQSRRQLERERIAAELAGAELELRQSREQRTLASAELALVTQRSAWINKGFRLGQFDLLAQLRSQQEQLDAEAQVQRAEHELGRAISRLNQAAGVLP